MTLFMKSIIAEKIFREKQRWDAITNLVICVVLEQQICSTYVKE